jgi:hypothetical protein
MTMALRKPLVRSRSTAITRLIAAGVTEGELVARVVRQF